MLYLETGGRDRSRSLKMAPFDRSYTTFCLVGHCKYVVPFSSYWTLNNVILKRALKVIQTGTIRKLGCGFLFTFHSNFETALFLNELV